MSQQSTVMEKEDAAPAYQPFEERLIKETKELATKVNKLHDFLKSELFYNLDRVEKDLLYAQFHAMLEYLQILGKRIELRNIRVNLWD